MLKLIVVALVVACVSSSVVPKPPVTHGEVKHDTPMVKSIPMHQEHHPSSEKPAEVKPEIKHDEKAKSILHHDMKSDEKKDHHQPASKKVEHHLDHHDNHDHHAALKHYDVPVNVGHSDKVAPDAHKPEKVETVKAKASDHKH